MFLIFSFIFFFYKKAFTRIGIRYFKRKALLFCCGVTLQGLTFEISFTPIQIRENFDGKKKFCHFQSQGL